MPSQFRVVDNMRDVIKKELDAEARMAMQRLKRANSSGVSA